VKRNRNLAILIVMFALQTAFVFYWDNSFKQGMTQRREMVMQDSAAGKIPTQQAASMASVLLETEYQVASYVRNALMMSLMFSFSMLLVATGERPKDESNSTIT
jgi:hypothetical protein